MKRNCSSSFSFIGIAFLGCFIIEGFNCLVPIVFNARVLFTIFCYSSYCICTPMNTSLRCWSISNISSGSLIFCNCIFFRTNCNYEGQLLLFRESIVWRLLYLIGVTRYFCNSSTDSHYCKAYWMKNTHSTFLDRTFFYKYIQAFSFFLGLIAWFRLVIIIFILPFVIYFTIAFRLESQLKVCHWHSHHLYWPKKSSWS